MTATAETPQATAHSFSNLWHDMFAALSNPNYRRYITGQAISLAGTWMQTVAQSWLVLELTGSPTAVGTIVATQMLPMLLVGPYAGVVADRVDKRRLMMVLQSMMGVLALVLGLLVVTGLVQLWHVYVLALLLGLNTCFENPTRQSFVLEMVGPGHLRNAVSLNSVLANAARAVGPGIAGLVIAAGGIGICFLINAATFIAVVVSLARLDTSKLSPSVPTPRAPGQLREGLRYAAGEPLILVPLAMMALVGVFAYEFQVVLPVVAQQTFGGDASAYGFLTAAMGAGAVVGGLMVAARGRTGLRVLMFAALAFGAAMTLVALAPNLTVALAGMALVGAASVAFLSMGNSTLQLTAAPTMRGRVMALMGVAFLGSTPIGGPLVGAISQAWGGRVGLGVGAASCVLAALMAAIAIRRTRARAAETADTTEAAGATAA